MLSFGSTIASVSFASFCFISIICVLSFREGNVSVSSQCQMSELSLAIWGVGSTTHPPWSHPAAEDLLQEVGSAHKQQQLHKTEGGKGILWHFAGGWGMERFGPLPTKVSEICWRPFCSSRGVCLHTVIEVTQQGLVQLILRVWAEAPEFMISHLWQHWDWL